MRKEERVVLEADGDASARMPAAALGGLPSPLKASPDSLPPSRKLILFLRPPQVLPYYVLST